MTREKSDEENGFWPENAKLASQFSYLSSGFSWESYLTPSGLHYISKGEIIVPVSKDCRVVRNVLMRVKYLPEALVHRER